MNGKDSKCGRNFGVKASRLDDVDHIRCEWRVEGEMAVSATGVERYKQMRVQV